MPNIAATSVASILLTKRGVAYVASTASTRVPDTIVRAVEAEFAAIGYALSSRLRSRLSNCTTDELAAFQTWAVSVLSDHRGGGRKHEPLFRNFPQDVPNDTVELWWRKVLVHFLQADDQPCLFCRRVGTTHVLNPCCHVVCDHCFDGANYSACPVCEHHVDRSSPFFQEAPVRDVPSERVRFKIIDVCESLSDEARSLFVSLCERKQALSPDDRKTLQVILTEYKMAVLPWIPDVIPVRENVAIVFGTLLQASARDDVIYNAKQHIKTATDILRIIAVMSGTDGSLQREAVFKEIEQTPSNRFWGRIAQLLGAKPPTFGPRKVYVPLRVCRFKTAKLSRPLRRAFLGTLEAMKPESLIEDMLRHKSYWVWVGEFLHPHEYAAKYPTVARAFQIIRGKAPDGTPAPHFQAWYSKLEEALSSRDTDRVLSVLVERPGEFARRFDHVLRSARDEASRERVVSTFIKKIPDFATPVLLTLRSHLSTRQAKAPARVYWPKGRIAKSASSRDDRATLSELSIGRSTAAIDAELLSRFSQKKQFETCFIDESLRDVTVPFNERTASSSAVSLPRGSRIPVPTGKLMRLFLHWCEPEQRGETTDLDLSVGFYDENWQYVGVCSYYQLHFKDSDHATIAQSSGDLCNAPWPDGATEFVDLHRDQARRAGIRYAVMVVNNYGGMPFSLLERGFAGIMLRDDPAGQHFDPRTVELKFALDGENGIFLPLVLDLRENCLHWLDVQSKGQFAMNNVAKSNSTITKICPELIAYFASGARMSMYDLSLLHAAARCRRVLLRGGAVSEFVRRQDEDAVAFHRRLTTGTADEPRSQSPRVTGPAMLAMLFRGDCELPPESSSYVLFPEKIFSSMSASDLIK